MCGEREFQSAADHAALHDGDYRLVRKLDALKHLMPALRCA
jgi:hypothetical protein